MKKQQIAQENKKIFIDCVRYALMEDAFHQTVTQSFYGPAHYGLGTASSSYGVLQIQTNVGCNDGNEVNDRNQRRAFMRTMRDFDLFGRVASLIRDAIGGVLNSEADVIENGYCFQFRITKYMDQENQHKFVEDPRAVTHPNMLLRVVELTITRVH